MREFVKKSIIFGAAVITGTWLFKKSSEVYDNRQNCKQKIDKIIEVCKD